MLSKSVISFSRCFRPSLNSNWDRLLPRNWSAMFSRCFCPSLNSNWEKKRPKNARRKFCWPARCPTFQAAGSSLLWTSRKSSCTLWKFKAWWPNLSATSRVCWSHILQPSLIAADILMKNCSKIFHKSIHLKLLYVGWFRVHHCQARLVWNYYNAKNAGIQIHSISLCQGPTPPNETDIVAWDHWMSFVETLRQRLMFSSNSFTTAGGKGSGTW